MLFFVIINEDLTRIIDINIVMYFKDIHINKKKNEQGDKNKTVINYTFILSKTMSFIVGVLLKFTGKLLKIIKISD